MNQKVVISQNLQAELAAAIAECNPDKLFVLVDEHTEKSCKPVVEAFDCLRNAHFITIPATDMHKDLQTLAQVWTALQGGGATRHSCLINLGGGMVTDLGGFAAATFKRGISFINLPTTLLSMVDASVGGKTGINFNGLKNEVGAFRNADCVILNTRFLQTLDDENIRSGYAEMLKHGLIADEQTWAALINYDLADARSPRQLAALQAMVADSVKVKERIVTADPFEAGLRKALNLGHTVGHAFESFAMESGRPVLHGYAVAYGLVCELYLSHALCGFPQDRLHQTVSFIRTHYGRMNITCDDYPVLLELMTHDKKNTAGTINFTLLAGIGDLKLDQTATKTLIEEALDFYREG